MTDPSGAGRWSPAVRFAAAVVIGAAGGALAERAGLPAGWLSGAMFAVGIAALAGLDAPVPGRLRDIIFVVLGVVMGTGVTPDVVAQLPAWPVTLGGLAATVVLVTLASYTFLRRIAGWDPASAFFGSIPGALTMTIAIAEQSPADMRRVSLSQTMRLFMLVAVLPLAVSAVETLPPAGEAVVVDDPLALAGLLAAGTAGGVAGVLLRIPSGLLLGAFVASGLLHGLGLVEGKLPAAIEVPAFVLLGATLGLRFAGTGLGQLVRMLVAVVGAFAVAMASASLCAIAVAAYVGMPAGQLLVAFAPGGLEVMVILAFVLKLDPAFVAGHHLARFLGMTVAVPLVAPLFYGKSQGSTTK